MNSNSDINIDHLDAVLQAELPELLERAERRRNALTEESISGQLRRAIAGRHLKEMADVAGVDSVTLADWFAGDATLPSDAIDRIARKLNLTLQIEPIQ